MSYKTRSILSMPIKDCSGRVIGVAQAVNKSSVQEEPFNEHDEKVMLTLYIDKQLGFHHSTFYGETNIAFGKNNLAPEKIFEEEICLQDIQE